MNEPGSSGEPPRSDPGKPARKDPHEPIAANETGPRADPWAHRRGEPRVFAFLWTMYLFAATLLTLASVGMREGLTREAYRPAARVLLLVVTIGVVWLWPMARLAQERPRGSARAAALADAMIVVLPALAIVIPQWFLAAWPIGHVAVMSGVLVGWSVLVAGWQALALSGGGSLAVRGAWMAGLVAVTTLAPAAGLATGNVTLGEGRGFEMDGTLAAGSPLTCLLDVAMRADERGPVGVSAVWSGLFAGGSGLALLGLSRLRGD